MARYSQNQLQLFDFPGSLVVDDKGLAGADRVVKLPHSVGNRSRYAFIFPRTADQGSGFVVEAREYVVAIFVGGTGGIGESTAMELFKRTVRPRIYIVGR